MGKVPNTIPVRKIRLINDEYGDFLSAQILRILNRKKIFYGTYYEESYSFWARVIPDLVLQEFDKFKNIDTEYLNSRDLRYLRLLKDFLNLASLQEEYDNDSLEDEEKYLRYLKLRLKYPLEYLKWSKLSKKERQEVDELLKQEDILQILKQKDKLTIGEMYVLEEKKYQEYVNSMTEFGKDLSKRINSIEMRNDSIQRDSFEIAKRIRFI